MARLGGTFLPCQALAFQVTCLGELALLAPALTKHQTSAPWRVAGPCASLELSKRVPGRRKHCAKVHGGPSYRRPSDLSAPWNVASDVAGQLSHRVRCRSTGVPRIATDFRAFGAPFQAGGLVAGVQCRSTRLLLQTLLVGLAQLADDSKGASNPSQAANAANAAGAPCPQRLDLPRPSDGQSQSMSAQLVTLNLARRPTPATLIVRRREAVQCSSARRTSYEVRTTAPGPEIANTSAPTTTTLVRTTSCDKHRETPLCDTQRPKLSIACFPSPPRRPTCTSPATRDAR